MLFRLAILFLVLSLGMAKADQAQTAPTGRWITAQHNAVIQIYPCGADMCGQIVGLLPAGPDGTMPTDWQGRPQCGMTIITTAPATDTDGSQVWQGTVLDPRNGNVYQAKIKLDPSRHLELHGYIGLPIFGQTQTWTPYSGRTMANCKLAAADVAAQPNG